jgi:hypothetical protein
MLVKIQSVDGGWKLIDNAQEIDYASNTRIIHRDEEKDELINFADCEENVLVLEGTFPLKIRTLKFKRHQQTYFVIFSTVVFICDDTGKTLEALRIDRKGDRNNG